MERYFSTLPYFHVNCTESSLSEIWAHNYHVSVRHGDEDSFNQSPLQQTVQKKPKAGGNKAFEDAFEPWEQVLRTVESI